MRDQVLHCMPSILQEKLASLTYFMVTIKVDVARTSMFPVSGALQLQASGAMKERPISCTHGAQRGKKKTGVVHSLRAAYGIRTSSCSLLLRYTVITLKILARYTPHE